MDPHDPATFRTARLMGEPAAVLYRAIESVLSDGPQPDRQIVAARVSSGSKAWERRCGKPGNRSAPFRQTLHGKVVSYDGVLKLTISPEKTTPVAIVSEGETDR